MQFDFDHYEHILEKIKKCRVELKPEDLATIYRKAFCKVLKEAEMETNHLISEVLGRRFPEGADQKDAVIAALHGRSQELSEIHLKVGCGEDLAIVLCDIFDFTDLIAEDVRKSGVRKKAYK